MAADSKPISERPRLSRVCQVIRRLIVCIILLYQCILAPGPTMMHGSSRVHASSKDDAWQRQRPCIIKVVALQVFRTPTPMMHGSNGVHASSKDDAWPRLRPCIISKEPTHAAVKVSQIFNTNILRSPFNEEEGRRLTQWSGRTPKRQAAFKRRVHTSTRGNNCSSTA